MMLSRGVTACFVIAVAAVVFGFRKDEKEIRRLFSMTGKELQEAVAHKMKEPFGAWGDKDEALNHQTKPEEAKPENGEEVEHDAITEPQKRDQKLRLSGSGSCPKLKAQLTDLCKYIRAKVQKVLTKGIEGIEGKRRIWNLAMRAAQLAATITKFKVGDCEDGEGDLSAAMQQLEFAKTSISQLAQQGESSTNNLMAAISQAEAEFAKPQEEQDLLAILGAFMQTLYPTQAQNHPLTQTNETSNEEIVEALSNSIDNSGDDHTELASLLEQGHGLVGPSTEDEKSGVAKKLAITAKFLGRAIAAAVLGILGLVWWLAACSGKIGLGWVSFGWGIAALIICAVGKFFRVIWPFHKSGGMFMSCVETLGKPVKGAWAAVEKVKKANPFGHAAALANPFK